MLNIQLYLRMHHLEKMQIEFNLLWHMFDSFSRVSVAASIFIFWEAHYTGRGVRIQLALRPTVWLDIPVASPTVSFVALDKAKRVWEGPENSGSVFRDPSSPLEGGRSMCSFRTQTAAQSTRFASFAAKHLCPNFAIY